MEHLYELLDESILQVPSMKRAPVIKNVFRRDIYERAKARAHHQAEGAMKEAEAYSAGVKIA